MTVRSTVRDPGTRRVLYWLLTTLTSVLLLLGYRTSSGPLLPSTAVVATGTTAAPAGGAAAGRATTYTGDVVATRWGPVQVQITAVDGSVTGVTAVQVPDGNRKDVAINARAVPVLEREALAAQSADIDTVTGATVTSDGYIASLQSALDEAGL